jgi:SAM-dependent methyltransferase
MERHSKGAITTENPQEHWGFLNVTGKKVLDLGCGINSEFTPTPWYFLQDMQAKQVIGVDGNPQSYEWFKNNFKVKNFIPIMDMVDRIEKFELYLGYYKPEIVKMDIEGSEILINALNVSYLESVQQIGIEYHNLSCLISCENKLTEAGFKLEYFNFEHLDIDYQGVLHGYKDFKPIELKKI